LCSLIKINNCTGLATNSVKGLVNSYNELKYSLLELNTVKPVKQYNRDVFVVLNEVHKRTITNYVFPTSALAEKKVAFVIVDKPRLAKLKVNHLKAQFGFTSIYIITTKCEMPPDMQERIKQNLGGFDYIYKTSEIELPEAVKDGVRLKSMFVHITL